MNSSQQSNVKKILVVSSDDIGYILQELDRFTMANEIIPSSAISANCQVYFTQKAFEKRANEIQNNTLLVKKMSICLLVKNLLKKIKSGLQITLYNGSKPSNEAIVLTLKQ